MELDRAIKGRRSVRKFTDHYVTDNEIEQIMEAAAWAPSWKNTQSWEYLVIRNKDLIRQVTECYSSTNPARQCSFNCSALIVACAQTKLAGYSNERDQRTIFPDWFMFDLGLSIQNLSLKAHALGLGTVIVGSIDHKAIKKVLDLDKKTNYEVVVTIPVGAISPGSYKAPTRKENKLLFKTL